MKPKVSIIFPTLNGWQDTQECLESITKLDYPREKVEVIVVDNGSTDGTVRFIKLLTGSRVNGLKKKKMNSLINNKLIIKLIENKKNLGFAKAVNQGIKKSKGEYLLITNNDVVFDQQYLKNLTYFLQKNPQVGIVGGKVYFKKGENHPEASGWMKPIPITSPEASTKRNREPRVLPVGIYYKHPKNKVVFCGARFNFYTGLLKPGQTPKKISETDWVPGCNMLVRRKILNKIGLFDEKLFFYFEDLDLCLRAKKAGYKVMYYPKAVLWHGEGAAINQEKWQKKSEYYYYGKTKVLFKHGSKLQIISSLLFQFLLGLPFHLFILKHNNYPAAIKALVNNLKNQS